MNKKVKVLHVAAFAGNVGDTGQIMGFRQQLAENTTMDFQYTNIEIRDFYQSWDKCKFDEKFIQLANQYDLIIFGGGNFWSVDWENSSNGTTLDLSEQVLDSIKVPIWFNALGFDDGINFKNNKIKDFERFMDKLVKDPGKYFLSVRNDGSKQLMYKYLPKRIVDKVYEVPDGGFFVKTEEKIHPEIPENKTIITINPAADMLDIRFKEGMVTEEGYLESFLNGLTELLDKYKDLHFVFVAHMPTDLEHIVKLINRLPDWYRRKRVTMAPFIPHYEQADYIFDLYGKSDIVIGGRFHSNLCAIAQGTPTIGILSYHKHKYIYEQYGLKHRMIEINKEVVSDKLVRLVDDMLLNKEIYVDENRRLVSHLKEILTINHCCVEKWLEGDF